MADEEPVRAFLRVGAAEWVESVCPTGDGDGTCGRESGSCRSSATCGSAERRIRLEARGSRGRVVRLSPPPHGLGLVGRGRRAQRRPRRRLEPGQRDQRSAGALRACDLDRRRRRASRRRSSFDGLDAIAARGRRGSSSRPAASAARRSGGRSSATPTASRSAASPAPCPAGSSSPTASGSWSTTTPTGSHGYTDSTRQRQGGSSPAEKSNWLRPSRVSSGDQGGNRALEQRRRREPRRPRRPSASRATSLPAERRPVEPVGDPRPSPRDAPAVVDRDERGHAAVRCGQARPSGRARRTARASGSSGSRPAAGRSGPAGRARRGASARTAPASGRP